MRSSNGEPLMLSRSSAPDSARVSETAGSPEVLADHQAEAPAAEGDGAGAGAGVEHALVVEDAVIGQFVLGAAGGDAAAIEDEGGVVKLGAVAPGAADDQAGAAIGRVGGEGFDGGFGGVDEGGLADEVFGRVAADGEFGGDDEVGAHGGGGGAGAADAGEIGVDLADMHIELRECDLHGDDFGGAGSGSSAPSRNSRPSLTRRSLL